MLCQRTGIGEQSRDNQVNRQNRTLVMHKLIISLCIDRSAPQVPPDEAALVPVQHRGVPRVHEPELAELIEVHADGGWCTSPLFNHLEHASEYLRQHAGQFQVDEVTEKLADHYLVKPTATVGSIAAMSDLLGVN